MPYFPMDFINFLTSESLNCFALQITDQIVYKQMNKQRPKIVFEYFTLAEDLPEQFSNELDTNNSYRILNKNSWVICLGEIMKNTFTSRLFVHIKQAHCYAIRAYSNANPSIIKDITQPLYTRLNTLLLSSNKISNIEGISFINMQTIETLHLRDNHITNLKPLERTKWSIFGAISVRGNKVSQTNLGRIKMSKKAIMMQFERDYRHKIINQDLSCICKVQSEQIETIGIDQESRIQQERVQQTILKKSSPTFVRFKLEY